jgi:hypothetical protein
MEASVVVRGVVEREVNAQTRRAALVMLLLSPHRTMHMESGCAGGGAKRSAPPGWPSSSRRRLRWWPSGASTQAS